MVEKTTNGDHNHSIADLVSDIESKKIKLWVDGEFLRYKAPKGVVTKEILQCIGDRKEEIIKYLSAESSAGIFYEPIQRVDEKEFYPMSTAQKRMFILNQMDNESTAYNQTQVLKVTGAVDKERVEWVINHIIERHEILRSSFEMIDGEPAQIVNKSVNFKIDFIECEEAQVENEIKRFIRPFDLSKAPLIRVTLVKVSDNNHIVLFDMDHLISDGISMAILIREISELYEGRELSPLKIQYKDFSYWQKQMLNTGIVKKQEEYWLNVFSGSIPAISMPTDYPRPPVRSFEGDRINVVLDEEFTVRLKSLADKMGATTYMVLLAAYNIMLHKYTGQEDIVVGTPVGGRRHSDLHSLIGMFVNTIAMRNFPEGSKTFEEFVQEVKKSTLKAFDNQDYQFEELVDKLNIERDTSRNPIFDTMFVLQNMGIPEIEISGLKFKPYEFANRMSKFDITLEAIEEGSGTIRLNLEYCTKLFKAETAKRMLLHYTNILKEMVMNPYSRLCDINMLSDEEERQILLEFNDTKAEYPAEKTLYRMLEEQAERTPDRVAAVFEGRELTYGELNARANQLARKLRNMGVRADSIVAVIVKRSLEMTIGIMAILKAGGAYLPIDPDYPEDRIGYMLEDSGARVLLTQTRYISNFEANESGAIVVDLDDSSLYTGNDSNLEPINDSRNLAYVIYTSGSTGKPKGAMIEHYSVINRINWMQKMYPIGANDVILQKTPFTFDVSVWELFWWSFVGAKVCFLVPGGEKDPKTIVRAIESNNITTMHFVPSMLNVFLEYLEGDSTDIDRLSGLRQVFASGEALNLQQVERFNSLLYGKYGTKLHNLYGPTEATVDVSYFDCSTGEKLEVVPIGKPIDNIQLYVVNKYNKLQPIGIAGELCIAGDGLARGYLNRPELTAEKFVPNPFTYGQRMYRTGDLVRWMPDGNIEYLGRIDHQVKIRGYRIELGEIEAEILKYNAVRETVVVARQASDGSKYLCAYLVTDEEITSGELREHLLKTLPDYMVPAHYVKLSKMPLSANGKVDRKSLPEPDMGLDTGKEYVPPTNILEEKLVKIWQDILGIEKVGINHDFFELGGHSLKATTLVSRMHKEFNVTVPLKEIFRLNTVKSLAEYLKVASRKEYSSIKLVEEKEYYPLSAAQRRLYILSQLEGFSTSYNLPAVMQVEGVLDTERLNKAVKTLIARHETLRTSFETIDGIPVQKVHQNVDFGIDLVEGQDVEKAVSNFVRPFKLNKAPLLRVGLVKQAQDKHIMVFDIHHIVSDGISLVVLINELVKLYQGGQPTELKIQYKDFTAWQNDFFKSEEVKKQEKYWTERFKDEIPVLNLPTDYPRPVMQSYEGSRINASLDRELVEGLKKIASETGTTLYMVLLGTYNTLLAKYTGQEDIVVGTPVMGRSHVDLEGLIGMFVNTLAMRNQPKGEKTFTEFLKEIKESSLEAFENQDYQFEELVEKLNIPRDMSRNPLFDTMFALQNMGIPEVEISGLKFKPYEFVNKVSKFDISLEALEESSGTVRLELEYCTKLFKAETAQRMLVHYTNILKGLVMNPDSRLCNLNMLSDEEERQILLEFNDTKAEYPAEKTLYRMLEEQAERTPDRVAAVFEGRELTYGELNARANQLARKIRDMGVTSDSIVAAVVKRSMEMTIGIMAILKAGGAYLPIDPDYPEDRISYMLEDSGARVLLTQERYFSRLETSGSGIAVVNLEDSSLYTGDDSNLEPINDSRNLAYVIYTSGSTGKPKGAMIEHYSVINRINWMQKKYPIGGNDVILQKTPFTFDVSVWELFWWFFVGAKVCFLVPDGEKDPETIVRAIENNNVTTMHFVPSMLNAFLEYIDGKVDLHRLKSLRQVFASGEALSLQQAQRFNKLLYSQCGTTLNNLYGPTEATVDVSYFDCSAGEELERVPIGKPIDNIQLYIVDKYNKLQPVGVAGELCIAGDGLARGYLNRPELNEEKFVPNPFKQGKKMYRTGDLARWLPDGNIEYLGRLDFQVKIRGFRIELGEIETQILKLDWIKEAVVMAREDKSGNKYICAYIVADKELVVPEIREHLLKELPDYMVPAYFVQIDNIPLSPNGKADRKALPEPTGRINAGEEYLSPRNELEEKIQDVWLKVLDAEKIGVNDNFFSIGGNSILLIQVHSQLEKLYPGKLTVTDLFAYTTISKLAEYIEKTDKAAKADLHVKKLKLPGEYFTSGTMAGEASAMSFNVQGAVFERLKKISMQLNIEIYDILLALYGYLLADITESDAVTVQTAGTKGDDVLSLDINLADIEEYSDLFRQVSSSRVKADIENTYSLKDIIKGVPDKGEHEILPLMCRRNFLNIKGDIDQVFDIVLELHESKEAASFMCGYNSGRFRTEKVKELVNTYIKLIGMLINKFNLE
ncbi:MAG: amino acid adenylation domain-containing protein [Clostridia bacterium]|nr:amino acid adenylation domain-containing protein [Clostridia bacterium]